MTWCLEFASKSRGVEPEGWKTEGLGHVWMGYEVRQRYMGIYLAIMSTVYMFRDFYNRKSTISNEVYRQNFFHRVDGRGGVWCEGRPCTPSCFVWFEHSRMATSHGKE